jgi:hypothetical protein
MTDQNSIPDSEDSTFSNTLLGRRRVLAFGLGAAALAIVSPLKGALGQHAHQRKDHGDLLARRRL